MKPIPINIHIKNATAAAIPFSLLIAHLAGIIGMTHWTQTPTHLTLRVDPSTPYITGAWAITRIARHLGGAARWSGALGGFQIDAGASQ